MGIVQVMSLKMEIIDYKLTEQEIVMLKSLGVDPLAHNISIIKTLL